MNRQFTQWPAWALGQFTKWKGNSWNVQSGLPYTVDDDAQTNLKHFVSRWFTEMLSEQANQGPLCNTAKKGEEGPFVQHSTGCRSSAGSAQAAQPSSRSSHAAESRAGGAAGSRSWSCRESHDRIQSLISNGHQTFAVAFSSESARSMRRETATPREMLAQRSRARMKGFLGEIEVPGEPESNRGARERGGGREGGREGEEGRGGGRGGGR